MTKQEKDAQQLFEEWKQLDEKDRMDVYHFVKQELRASSLGLNLHFDNHTSFFYIADATTNCVIAPPPMNLATVTAWLDDYEKEAAAE